MIEEGQGSSAPPPAVTLLHADLLVSNGVVHYVGGIMGVDTKLTRNLRYPIG